MTTKTEQSDQSAYYQHSGSVPLASKISLHVRRKMFRTFLEVFRPDRRMRVLDVGVTSDTVHPESNLFEKLYPHPEQITCVGTEDGSHLEGQYPGLRFVGIEPGQPLPFGYGEFDIVFSNAVIEHVGSRRVQAQFVREICRVGKCFFITTPNRWFPIEHHTGLPLLHFLPPATFRAVIRNSRYNYWATEETLNLLTANEFAALFPTGATVKISREKVAGVTSNLAAHGNSRT